MATPNPAPTTDQRTRCFGDSSELYRNYHDQEWGVPVHDDRHLFELLILEGAQAGLSWSTILNKRDNYRRAFCNFDPTAVARLTPARLLQLRDDPGIVRNRLKIEAAPRNARAFLQVQTEYGSFDRYLWAFVENRPIQNRWRSMKEVPAKTEIAIRLSKELQKRDFTFVGPTICYAFMQAVGMVNDHILDCFRHREVANLR